MVRIICSYAKALQRRPFSAVRRHCPPQILMLTVQDVWVGVRLEEPGVREADRGNLVCGHRPCPGI